MEEEIKLDNNEKLYILELKGKFRHLDNANDIILGNAYAIEPEKITDITRKAFIHQLYSKLLKLNILFPHEDKIDLLMKYLLREKDDPMATMMSDIRWLTADQMKLVEVYDCDISIVS